MASRKQSKSRPRPAKDSTPRSSLAPKRFARLSPLEGVHLATAAADIRYRGRDDLLLVTLAPGTRAAGVFTQSKCASAPVEHCRAILPQGRARALVVNSGNANAFTGRAGVEAARAVASECAAAIGCDAREVYLASTGVIGEPLPADKIVRALPQLAANAKPANWRAAAAAIMTTDTYPKLATAAAEIDGCPVTLNGIAKGSGMIAPDMATLLAFVFTDANIATPALQALVREAVQPSFNSITVDSDTSTSDTLLAFATGRAPHRRVARAGDRRLADFRAALNAVLLDLALQVVRDGEGARKLIVVEVAGARSAQSARRIARSIADSPLVKTAIAGGDANWGRVVMAIGKAGEPADPDRLKIWFGGAAREREARASAFTEEGVFATKGILVAENGARAADYNEAAATKAVSGREVTIAVDLGLGAGRARLYTCDLTDGYIRINASYRS